MTPRTKGRFILLPMLLCVCLILCSCGSNESTENLLQYPLTLQQRIHLRLPQMLPDPGTILLLY